MTEAVSL